MIEFLENLAFSFNLTMKQLWVIVGIILMIIAIPLVTLLLRQTQIFKSQASDKKTVKQLTATTSASLKQTPQEIPASSPLTDLKALLEAPSTSVPTSSSPSASTDTSSLNLSFGPVLTVKVNLEGRPAGKQAAKIFVGIATGTTTTRPTYLLTFTIDVPASGIFSGLSLAGLNPGSTYTAYLKGPGQIDNASTFVMGPTETTLNSNQALLLLSGDLNEDNTVNSADYTIAKTAYGATSTSTNWNSRTDFNQDGVINNFDMAYVLKNFGKTGVSGIWYSPIPSATVSATPAASLTTQPATGGYWLYIP